MYYCNSSYCNSNPVMMIDDKGNSALLAMLIGAGIGALVGLIGQAARDTVSNFNKYNFDMSKWQYSSWQTYVGAGVGGAVAGALTPFMGPVSTSTINSAISSIVGMGLENLTGESNYSMGQMLFTTAFSASMSGLTAGIFSKVKIPRISKGAGSLSAIQKQINTKLVRNKIARISTKTLGKMFRLELYNSVPSSLFNSFYNGIVLTPITDAY